ncbi:hypothetical protein J5226_04365 [Lysobacter sp. K5869]|uniref:hypothetical protein n=1 Tax=Lysobacter sp. K5869 TaxID=2820808 RepID=UPI001C06483A|nr:hypothetical protein [Lysobacter sp. K5869]QWP77652.1 hypothetical protein J5226_04365 [Lysobacter sp. K5869]
MTLYRALALSAFVLTLSACAKPVPEASPQEARGTFISACERRLGNRTSLGAERATRFCGCFADAAVAKHDLNRLNAEMASGSDEAFKATLKDEFEQCKRRM